MRRSVAFALLAMVLAALTFVSAAYADPNNNNSEKLRNAVTLEGVRAHQQALQQIADANGGNRFAGLPGHDESVAYVVDIRDVRSDVARVRLGDRPEVDALDIRDHAGRRLLEGRGTNLREREVIERLHDRVVACRLERVDHVGDGLVVARQTREPVAAVGVRDLL